MKKLDRLIDIYKISNGNIYEDGTEYVPIFSNTDKIINFLVIEKNRQTYYVNSPFRRHGYIDINNTKCDKVILFTGNYSEAVALSEKLKTPVILVFTIKGYRLSKARAAKIYKTVYDCTKYNDDASSVMYHLLDDLPDWNLNSNHLDTTIPSAPYTHPMISNAECTSMSTDYNTFFYMRNMLMLLYARSKEMAIASRSHILLTSGEYNNNTETSKCETVKAHEEVEPSDPGSATVYTGQPLLSHWGSPNWLIRNYLSRGESIGFLYGPSGVGKTFVGLDMCLHIASGYPTWHGNICHPGKVLYLAGESKQAINERIMSFSEAHKTTAFIANFAVVYLQQALSSPEGMKALLEAIRNGSIPFNPDLLVIDTLNCFFSGDENNAQEVAEFKIDVLLPLQSYFKCNIMIVHHTPKGADSELRGSTALKGMADYTILVSKEGDFLKAEITKDRCGHEHEFEKFEFFPVNLTKMWGYDEDGFTASGAVLKHVGSSRIEGKITNQQRENLSILIDAMLDGGTIHESGIWMIGAEKFRKYLNKQTEMTKDVIKKVFCTWNSNRFFPALINANLVSVSFDDQGHMSYIYIVSKKICESITKKKKEKIVAENTKSSS